MTLSNACLFFAYSGCFFLWSIAALSLDLFIPELDVLDDFVERDVHLSHPFDESNSVFIAEVAQEPPVTFTTIPLESAWTTFVVVVLVGLELVEGSATNRTGILLLASLCILSLQSRVVNLS